MTHVAEWPWREKKKEKKGEAVLISSAKCSSLSGVSYLRIWPDRGRDSDGASRWQQDERERMGRQGHDPLSGRHLFDLPAVLVPDRISPPDCAHSCNAPEGAEGYHGQIRLLCAFCAGSCCQHEDEPSISGKVVGTAENADGTETRAVFCHSSPAPHKKCVSYTVPRSSPHSVWLWYVHSYIYFWSLWHAYGICSPFTVTLCGIRFVNYILFSRCICELLRIGFVACVYT